MLRQCLLLVTVVRWPSGRPAETFSRIQIKVTDIESEERLRGDDSTLLTAISRSAVASLSVMKSWKMTTSGER